MPVVASTRSRARALARKLRHAPEMLIAHATRAFTFGDRHLAFELCRAAPAAVARMTPRQVRHFAREMDDWAATDCFAVFIAGVAWREGALGDAEIARWTRSPDRWFRRAALAATVPLNSVARGANGTSGDATRTLRICQRLVDDRDDMVIKAMSWALRELAKRDPSAVIRFLRRYEDQLAPRVRREVRNKLETGLKNPKSNATDPRSRRKAT